MPTNTPSDLQEQLHDANIRRNALLLFAKPPMPGLVKTRLTTLKDGSLTPEIASSLYHCMFFDVVEICCDALAELERAADEPAYDAADEPARSTADEPDPGTDGDAGTGAFHDIYDLFISTTPRENVAVMEDLFARSGTWPRPITFICDEGKSFDEHYQDSFDQVLGRGYDTILSMGVDMPTLPRSVVIEGFEQLHALCGREDGGIVISPDQEMGVSLIGWTKETDFDHQGVFYNREGLTVLPAYIAKARERSLPAILLPAVVDIDTMLDLLHNITLLDAIGYCAPHCGLSVPWRTIDALHTIGLDEVRVPPNDLHDPREGIDV